MLKERPFPSNTANKARFGRRHLADERLIDRIVSEGHALDIEKRLIPRRPHVAGVLAERTFMLESVGRDFSLEDNLRSRRNLERNGLARDQFNRLAAQRSGHR